MKKMMAICGVFVMVLAFAGVAAADCGGCDKTASNDGAGCDKAAAAKASNDGAGCDKSAVKTASNDGAGCDKAAVKTASNEGSSCSKTAAWMKAITPESALNQMNMPLHMGAYKYYKEIGIEVPAEIMPPEAK